MNAELVQFAASLVAVALLVWAVHLAGFSRPARPLDESEARELARLAPGGFVPLRLALDLGGRGAIAADSAGRLLLLRPHGAQFVAEPVSAAAIRAGEGSLLIDAGGCITTLNLGAEAGSWPVADRMTEAR